MVTLQIWTNRLLREFDDINSRLPVGVTIEKHEMDNEKGICKATFRFTNFASDTNGEPSMMELGVDCGLSTRYPFEAPIFELQQGAQFVPEEVMDGKKLILPAFNDWTPSNTIVATLASVLEILKLKAAGKSLSHLLPNKDRKANNAGGSQQPGAEVSTEDVTDNLFQCKVKTVYGRKLSRYLAVTNTSVLELEAHRTQMGKLIVLEAYNLKLISKLKFRKQHSLTIMFKNGAHRTFLLESSEECVEAIRMKLARHGIDGRRTTAAKDRQLDQANWVLLKAEKKERELKRNPTIENVQTVMALYREAAEAFGAVEDSSYQKVIQQMQEFLSLPMVTDILEGKTVKSEETPSPVVIDEKKWKKGDVIDTSWDTDSDDGLAQEEQRHQEGLQSLQKDIKRIEDEDEDFAIDLGQGTNTLEELEVPSVVQGSKSAENDFSETAAADGEPKDGEEMSGLRHGLPSDDSKGGPNFFLSAFDDDSRQLSGATAEDAKGSQSPLVKTDTPTKEKIDTPDHGPDEFSVAMEKAKISEVPANHIKHATESNCEDDKEQNGSHQENQEESNIVEKESS